MKLTRGGKAHNKALKFATALRAFAEPKMGVGFESCMARQSNCDLATEYSRGGYLR